MGTVEDQGLRELSAMEDGYLTTITEAVRTTARNKLHKAGEVEIDEDAKVSLSHDEYGDKYRLRGAYIQAWLWLGVEEIE